MARARRETTAKIPAQVARGLCCYTSSRLDVTSAENPPPEEELLLRLMRGRGGFLSAITSLAAAMLRPLADAMRRAPLLAFAIGGVLTAALLATGFAAGNWAGERQLRGRVVAKLENTFVGRLLGWADDGRIPDVQSLNWKTHPPLISNLHSLQVVKMRLAPFETYGEGGAIEEISGNILYASPLGQLGYVDGRYSIRTIETRVPMNLDVLKAHPIFDHLDFAITYFRTLDLLAVPEGPAGFTLYASHHRFNASGCFEFVISRTEGRVSDGGLEFSGSWTEVFVARPCMLPKDSDLFWGGLEAGGRLAFLDNQTLLVTIGDHQFDGVRSETAAAQDPDADLGKIVAIDVASGRARIFTSGHRNPQGLLVARDGTVWATEHGPQGGDEINLIREGLNYGWPQVTYGMEYGQEPRRNWPLNPEQGRHDGYELPAFVFVPSIGISNLVQPDPREWPRWRDHLLVSSFGGYLRGGVGKLYLARVERDKRIVYSEEIMVPLQYLERLRDIISLTDGRFAVLAEPATLLLFRNADAEKTSVSPREDGFEVTLDVAAKAALASSESNTLLPSVELGRQLFASKCVTCHSLNGQIKTGPPLNGVIGRQIGASHGFGYSPGMKAAKDVWSRWNLIPFLQELNQPFEGSAMPPARLSYASSAAIADYLETQ